MLSLQRKNVRKNYNIETAEINADGDKIVEYNTSITSHLEIHLYWSGYGSYPESNGPLISAISVIKGIFYIYGVLSFIFFSVLSKTTIL